MTYDGSESVLEAYFKPMWYRRWGAIKRQCERGCGGGRVETAPVGVVEAGSGSVGSDGAGVEVAVGGRVKTAPMRMGWGRLNEVGGNGRAGVKVAMEAVSRRRRCSGVEAGSAGGSVVARWQWRSCRGGSRVSGVEGGVAAMLSRVEGQRGAKPRDSNNRDEAHVSGRQGGLGARMPRGVKVVEGGLDDGGDTILRSALVRDEREKRKEKKHSFAFGGKRGGGGKLVFEFEQVVTRDA
ncbi:hypothetical protein EDB85DRAFT_1899377 [Lactarius pseudohatsudake]|nr:hypothetical protein EDB85DRAFT_1899377 [Lactarius pseudohatsudake]